MMSWSQLISFLFPDAASVWGFIATLTGIFGLIYGALGYHHRRRLDQEKTPIVSASCQPLKGTNDWFRVTLGISNPLPFTISCRQVSVLKPRVGVLILREEDAQKRDQMNNPILDLPTLSAVSSKAQQRIPLEFDIEREGTASRPYGGGRSTADREYRHFLLRRDIQAAKTNLISMSALISYHDPDQRKVEIRFVATSEP